MKAGMTLAVVNTYTERILALAKGKERNNIITTSLFRIDDNYEFIPSYIKARYDCIAKQV